MVLFEPRRIRQLKEEGHREADAEWIAWLKRHDEALANSKPFDEPPPSECRGNRG